MKHYLINRYMHIAVDDIDLIDERLILFFKQLSLLLGEIRDLESFEDESFIKSKGTSFEVSDSIVRKLELLDDYARVMNLFMKEYELVYDEVAKTIIIEISARKG